MIELLQGFSDNTVAAACKGRVVADDYEKVLLPRVRQALESHDKLRVYLQIGDDFESVEPGAVWDDIKVGMGHRRSWERIAVVTDVAWIRDAMKVFGFLIPGAMKVFPVAEMSQAREWIAAP
jgi:hypothetical protein